MKFGRKLFLLSILCLTTGFQLEARDADRIRTEFEARGFNPEIRSLFSDYGSFGSSVHLYFPSARDSASTTLLIALPQTDSAEFEKHSGYQTALKLADKIKEQRLPVNIHIAFLADEKFPAATKHLQSNHPGLRDLLDLYENPESVQLLYLDLAENTSSFVLRHGAPGYISPLSLVKNLTEALDTHIIPYSIPVYYNELYRLSLVDGPEALHYALSRQVPALYIEGVRDRTKPVLNPQKLADMIYDYAQNSMSGNIKHDYHYTIVRLASHTFFLSELFTILSFLFFWTLAVSIIVIYTITHRQKLIIMWTVFLKRSWIIPLYFLLLLGTLLCSSLMTSFILNRTSGAAAAPGFGEAVLKFLMAIALFNLMSPLLKLFRIPKRAHYYGNSAVILLGLGTLLTAYFDITFLPVFLWAFIFTFLSSSIHIPQFVFILALAAPVQIFGILGSAIGAGSSNMGALLSSTSLPVNTFLALVSLPFIFNFKRAALLFSKKNRVRRPLRIWLPRILFFTGILISLVQYGVDLKKNSKLAPVLKTETTEAPVEFYLEHDSAVFLDRRIIKLRMESSVHPVQFKVSMQADSGQRILIYDAEMPYNLSSDGRNVDFILGLQPDNPFITDIVIPAPASVTIQAEMLYLDSEEKLKQREKTIRIP